VATRFLDDEARQGFAKAIAVVENASSVEVVVAVRRRSARYLHANAVIGVAVAMLGLAAMLFAAHRFSDSAILIDPIIVGVAAAAVVELLPQFKRVLTPAAIRRRNVERAARATFVERGVHNTRGRTGLLVYISWLEQQVALVADGGLASALPAGALAAAEAELTAAMARGGAEVAKRVAALAPAMGAAVPHLPDDINELPDAIDSDLTRTDRRRRP
jgi:putative membrane protein